MLLASLPPCLAVWWCAIFPATEQEIVGYFGSVPQSCPTLCDPMDYSTPGFHVHYQSLLKLMSIELVMPSNHLILCHPLLLLPSIFLSIKVFSYASDLCIRWPKYWSFSISPPNEHSGLISFRIDWFDFLAVQEIHKSLLQHHGSKASILQCSAFSLCHNVIAIFVIVLLSLL